MPRSAAQIQFDTLSIEGGLFTAEWLGKVAGFDAPAQGERDYQVRAGFTLREEIALSWRAAQALWAQFTAARPGGGQLSVTAAQHFVTDLLRQAFGFHLHSASTPTMADGRSFPIGHFAFDGTVPVVTGEPALGLDGADERFGDSDGARRRRSAFGLVQEYLNAQNAAVWGIASNGMLLRVARDNASLTRPAWLEADLERIFTDGNQAEFSVLWLLLHASRFGAENVAPSECVLERWRDACRDQGIRAREVLREGVGQALQVLGQGFLAHPANAALRDGLASSRLSTRDFFQQLLRQVYRQIFLLTIEERAILHSEDSEPAARELYAEGYSLRRLRDRAVRRNAHDRHHDLWEGLKLVWSGLATGEARLALPALGGLFAAHQCHDLDGARLENRHLLLALFHLAWLRDRNQPNAPLTRVNWRDMGPEELGSIYESLLELVPQIGDDGRSFSFLQGAETRGNARKTTGSYYTPDSLVQVLLDSALEPVIVDTIATNPGDPVEALLGLSIVDPACGSGHFLLAAARRLAAQVARLQANGTPSAAEYRRAMRQVVSHCIYGVDLNPMAVELCKVSLWMEAVEPGLPLTFLNSHIQHGNALLGTTPELMAKGIPNPAWEPIEGDDRKIASALKKRNKQAATGQRTLATYWSTPAQAEAQAVARAVAELEAASDADAAALANKESQWDGILDSAAYRHQKFVADAWCAAFVWPKQLGGLADAAPTNDLWRQIRDGQGQPPPLTTKTVNDLAGQYRFFHWHLQFPQVFAKGGFDVVLGNPPWERVKLQEQEFFASRSEEIAGAANAAARKKLIAKLSQDNPQLWADWCKASRVAEGESHVVRQSGRYPLCGKGDVNTYAVFAEHNRDVLAPSGRAGFIVPPGLATDDTTKAYFQELVGRNGLIALFEFENEEFLFPGIDHRVRFIVITVARERPPGSDGVDISFGNRNIQSLADTSRHFSLSSEDFSILNPNTRTCPRFRSRRDANINLAMYRRAGVLWTESDEGSSNPWGMQVRTRLWHMAEDSEWFRTRDSLETQGWHRAGASFERNGEHYLPLIEAKMVHQFDHRFGTYEGQSRAQENQGKLPELDDSAHSDPCKLVLPYYWVPGGEVTDRLASFWARQWLIGWRDITYAANQRTLIASLVPRSAAGDKFPLMFPGREANLAPALYANLCSFVLDYAARQKVGGTSLKLFVLKQLPVLAPETYANDAPWHYGTVLRAWLLSRVLELTYTAWDLEPFARDVGYRGSPFRWDPERRFLLRCELDAAFFHLYGLSREDTDYVMDTFPIVRRNDEKVHGKYRTKRLILEIYDEMAEAERTGEPYRTRLEPPPAHWGVAHPDTRGAAPIRTLPLET